MIFLIIIIFFLSFESAQVDNKLFLLGNVPATHDWDVTPQRGMASLSASSENDQERRVMDFLQERMFG